MGQATLADSENPRLDARLLLSHVLQKEYVYLLGHGEDALAPEQEAAYKRLLSQAAQNMPIPYLTGHADFYGRRFVVSPAVLIPRPETEELVALALAWLEKRPGAQVVDVGTGSGCIAVTLACETEEAAILAVDISPEALAIARQNAERHGVEARVQFLQGSLLAPVEAPVDLILANLPYVTDTEWEALAQSVREHEPALALRGGDDGLALIRDLLSESSDKLRPGGAILLEIGWQQGPAALALARRFFPDEAVRLLKDLSGLDRFILIQTS